MTDPHGSELPPAACALDAPGLEAQLGRCRALSIGVDDPSMAPAVDAIAHSLGV
jgi:hypothetical protein